MAGKVIGTSFSSFFGTRAYAAQAAAASAAKKPQGSEGISLPKQDLKVTTLPNGLIVASIENYSPISRVGIFVKGGARYESKDQLGVSHALRNAAGTSTKNSTVFGLIRNLEYVGSNLSASVTRDVLSYELACNRDHVAAGFKYLAEVATKTAFNPWELSDIKSRLAYEVANLNINPSAVLIEALHKAAYRGGLSNSLYTPSFMIGKHNQEMLQNYVAQILGANRTAIVGLGVDHGFLLDYVNKNITLDSVTGTDGASKYQGGEVFIDSSSPLAHVAIASEGAGLTNTKEALSLAVLQMLLGRGQKVVYGDGNTNKLGQAVSKVTSKPFAISAINLIHADSALFGFYVVGNPKDMKQIVQASVTKMREVAKAPPSAKDLAIAKHQCKATLNILSENQSDILGYMGDNLIATGGTPSDSDFMATIDSISAQDVATAAAKIIKGKPAMAAYGQLQNVPHLEELV